MRLAATFFMISLGATAFEARACNPRDFMVKEVKDIQKSGETELAFVLTATEEEFNSAKKNAPASGAYGLISGSGSYGEAQEKARRIAQAVKFDYKNSYASSYFAQTLSPKALDNYVKCLEHDKQTPGLALWLQERQGDFLTFKTFWVGTDTGKAVAKWDAQPAVIGGTVVSKPDTWVKARTEEVVVKRNSNEDIFIQLKVGGQVKSIVVVKDPPAVVWDKKPVASDKVIKTASHGPDPGCQAGDVTDCIYPTRPGGSFVAGSAAMTERTSSEPGQYNESFYKNTPDQICVKMAQSTSNCKVSQSAQGRLSALESFPRAAE